MRSFINTLTLIIFTLGTIQFASVVSSCKMMGRSISSIQCACLGEVSEGGAYLSSEKMVCCSAKKFEKDRVQDFTNFKDEASKLISFQVNLKTAVIYPQITLIPRFSPLEFSPPLKFEIPILNSSLLI